MIIKKYIAWISREDINDNIAKTVLPYVVLTRLMRLTFRRLNASPLDLEKTCLRAPGS